ncbi:hypothetical protein OSTOST_07651 [Ostertagia ostertagi]
MKAEIRMHSQLDTTRDLLEQKLVNEEADLLPTETVPLSLPQTCEKDAKGLRIAPVDPVLTMDAHGYEFNGVPEGAHVRFRLSDGEFPCSYGCQSYVEIKHKLDIRLTGFRSCCYRPKEDTISESNQVFIIYHPNGRTARFSLRFKRQV